MFIIAAKGRRLKCNSQGRIIKLDLFIVCVVHILEQTVTIQCNGTCCLKQNKSVNSVVYSRETDSDNTSGVLLNRNNFKQQQLTTIIINLINIFTCVVNQINFSKVNHILVYRHLLTN